MKILNLYAGIGGNRKLWGDDHEITAVELDPVIAAIYADFFPNDTVIVGDAHQYLLDHYQEFDFIWTSPPCLTHSKLKPVLYSKGNIRYPDMALYQEIIFLQHNFSGRWVAENVEPYYRPLIQPTTFLDRHFFWSNFPIGFTVPQREGNMVFSTVASLSKDLDITLPKGTKDKRRLLRNAVNPRIGFHILKAALKPYELQMELVA